MYPSENSAPKFLSLFTKVHLSLYKYWNSSTCRWIRSAVSFRINIPQVGTCTGMHSSELKQDFFNVAHNLKLAILECRCSQCSSTGSSNNYPLIGSEHLWVCSQMSKAPSKQISVFLPYLHLKWFNEGWAPHSLRLDNMIVQQHLDFVHCW